MHPSELVGRFFDPPHQWGASSTRHTRLSLRAGIKQGDLLTSAEIEQLLEMWLSTD